MDSNIAREGSADKLEIFLEMGHAIDRMLVPHHIYQFGEILCK